jgi:hypothetical protein
LSHNINHHTPCFRNVFDQAILCIDKGLLLLDILRLPHDHYHSPSSNNNHTPDDHFRHLFHPPVLHLDQVILLLYIVRVPHHNNNYASSNNPTDNHFRHLFHPLILRFV